MSKIVFQNKHKNSIENEYIKIICLDTDMVISSYDGSDTCVISLDKDKAMNMAHSIMNYYSDNKEGQHGILQYSERKSMFNKK